nr:fibrous sheath-interacting protein 2 isoform X2 [Oryctolagus cuniculus]
MELYLSNCCKTAEAAANKVAASSLNEEKEQCSIRGGPALQRNLFPEVGACNLLDLPLGVKLPIIPGSHNVFYTTDISEKLYQPSYDFNLTDPYCRLLETSYKSLHDPHLKTYYKRKDVLRRLKKGGYITSNNKKMIEKQVHKLYESKRAYDSCEAALFQEWLLQEDTQTTPEQEQLLKHRYADMIHRELHKAQHTAEKRNAVCTKEQKSQHQDHIRRKLDLRKQIEDKWKTKEMLLLSKIGEEVRREARIEEQRQKIREEIDRKKKALLEKKIAHHLQKMQRHDLKRGREGSLFSGKGQDETEGSVHYSHNTNKISAKKPTTSFSQKEAQQKKDKEITNTSDPVNVKGVKRTQIHASTKATNFPRQSVQHILKEEVSYADLRERKPKKSKFSHKSVHKTVYVPDSSEKQEYSNEHLCQEKVTSEELNSIIRNIMAWVVASVTSILYPAITNYEERVKNNAHPVSADSAPSSCSTCSYMLMYTGTKTFQTEPSAKAADRSMEQPTTPLIPSPAPINRTAAEKAHPKKRQSVPSEINDDEVYEYTGLKACKSDTHLFVSTERNSKKSRDAATETDDLEHPQSSDGKATIENEKQELTNAFVKFKSYLKEETEVILQNIFQEMVSNLNEAIPTLSTVVADDLPDQTDRDSEDLLSDIDTSSAADEIVESVLDKLQSAAQKKCMEVFSQDVPVHFKSDSTPSGEHLISPTEKPSEGSLPYASENMGDIAEDMVHVILEKLLVLASSKQNQLADDVMPESTHQLCLTDPTYTCFQKVGKRKSSVEYDAANLIAEEEIQNLVSNILSQSSLLVNIEEAICTILDYIQTGLCNERLTSSEETVATLRLLDDILTQLHWKSVKTDIGKTRQPRLGSPFITEENRLAGTGVAGPRNRQLFPPINVPGMVLYAEDEKEEHKIVEEALIPCIKDEKANLQEQLANRQSAQGNADLKYNQIANSPATPACQGKVAFQDWGLKSNFPTFNNKDVFKDTLCLNKDTWIFSQHEKHQIQKASKNIITNILAEVLKDTSSVFLDQEATPLTSEKSGLSHLEQLGQMFSVSEIDTVAHEIADAVLKILSIASTHIINDSKHSACSSVHETSLNNAEIPDKDPLEIWFESEKKMNIIAALSTDPEDHLWLESGNNESTSDTVFHINDKITHTIFKKLKSFLYRKLQKCFKSESHTSNLKPTPSKKSLFQSELSSYTTKVVKIVLDSIQKKLKHNRQNQNFREKGPAKKFTDTGFFANTENELDSFVTKLNNDIMTSSLVSCICEVLNEKPEKHNVPLPSNKGISYENTDINQPIFSPFHCPPGQKEVHICTTWQVLDKIGDILCDMLCNLVGGYPHSPQSDSEPKGERSNENLRMNTEMQPDIQLISHTILEYIITKLCSAEMNGSLKHSEFKETSEYFDISSLSFASLMEEMSRCSDIISSMMSSVIQQGSQEVTTSKGKTTVPQTGSMPKKYTNKLKIMASDILETVFAILKGFANRSFKTLGAVINGNKKGNTTDWESEGTNMWPTTHDKLLKSALHIRTKKASSAILKAIQTELNASLPDLETCVHNPPQEKQMLKKLVNLILDGMPPDKFNETELEERSIEYYRYKPVYGNFLPGGAGPETYLEDPEDTEKECDGEKRPPEETKSDCLEQQKLERTLKKIESELREPQKSPVVPIIRHILKEIFQNDLIDQINVRPVLHSKLCDTPHANDEPVEGLDKTMDPLISEADVITVADNIIRTIFQKLHSATMTDRNAGENRWDTLSNPTSICFPEHASGQKPSVHFTILDRNPCSLTRFSADKLTTVDVVEDIIQSVLANLERFATSKVKSYFCPLIRVPMTLQQDVTALSQSWSSTKNSYSSDQLSCHSVDHKKSRKATSKCQLTTSKLHIYATQVAKQILQEIKRKLDKEAKSPFLTHNIVVSESITSQIVNTVLDCLSAKGKCEKSISDTQIDSSEPEYVVKKLFNKKDYRKKLQSQILETIECILSDICEKMLEENNFPHDTSSHKGNGSWGHLEVNSEMVPECANMAVPMILVPNSCVAVISNDMVDIVLENISSAVTVGLSAKYSMSARMSPGLCDAYPKEQCQQSAMDSQATVLKEQDTKQSALNSYEENANCITKAILDRLKSFATERIDLLTLDSKPREKSFISPEFTNYKQDDTVFLKSNQISSDVNGLKLSTNETILSEGVTDDKFANYEEWGPAIHLSQASLKEYAKIIASTILMLIKNDVDLEIQMTYSYPNITLFLENTIASETVNNILKSLHDKISLKESSLHSKHNFTLFPQPALQNKLLHGQRKVEDNTELPLISKCLDQNQISSEEENLRRILEGIFRNGESRQEKTSPLFSAVREIVKKVYRRVMEDKDHWPPFNNPSRFPSDFKIRTAAQKNILQSRIGSVTNDIIKNVFETMLLVVLTSLYENNETRSELEASGSDKLLMNVSCFKGVKQAEKRRAFPEHLIRRGYPFTGTKNVTSMETTSLHCFPLQVGKELVQNVLTKITNFALLDLGQSHESRFLRPCNSKMNPKGSPGPGFKKDFKTKSKVTSLPKFATPPLELGGGKAKSKTKLGLGVKIPRDSKSKTIIGLQELLSTGDAKRPSVRTKLPTAELKMYANDIVCNILETIVNKFQKVKQSRAMVNMQTFPSDQLEKAREIVNTVLQGVYAMKNNLADPKKGSCSDNRKHLWKILSTISPPNPEAQFYLENVCSQPEKIFPTEDIFMQIFGKRPTESSEMENEKHKLLMITETVLHEILIKTKELEQPVSLLNLSPLKACESRQHSFQRAVDSQTQINMFGKAIIEMLFQKLKFCFSTLMFLKDSKETQVSKKQALERSNNINSTPIYDTEVEDTRDLLSSHQVTQEIIEGVLNILESFADLQLKHISRYTFSEIVKVPIEKFFAVQQKPSVKKLLPSFQSLNVFPDESKHSAVTPQGNIQDTLRQLHSFHTELLTYATNTVRDMLGIIKNKLDQEKLQVGLSSDSAFEDSTVTSQIISTLIEQCTHFYKSFIKNQQKEDQLKGDCNINQNEFTNRVKMPTSELEGVNHRNDPSQIPAFMFPSEGDSKGSDRVSSKFSSCASHCVGDTTKTTHTMKKLKPVFKPSYSRSEAQDLHHFDQGMKGNKTLPKDSVLPKLPQKSIISAQAALEHATSFGEGEAEENQMLHSNQTQTSVSPVKVCLAAENDIDNVLRRSEFLGSLHGNASMETVQPLLISNERALSVMSKEKGENSLLKTWGKRFSCKTEKENKSHEASGDFTLLEKWENKSPNSEKIATFEEAEVIDFTDQELGANEIHLVARYITTSVVTHFKNFETRGPHDQKVYMISTPLREKYEFKKTLRSINTDSSLKKFCERLTELVISHIMLRISDCTEDSGMVQKVLERKDATFTKFIIVHSQEFKSQIISIRELALSISEIIILILFNNNILKEDTTQQTVSVKTKYIYCLRVAATDFNELFQDLLMGVIHVLSKEIGMSLHPESKQRNKSLFMRGGHSLTICNKTKSMKRQTCSRDWKSTSLPHIDQLLPEDKLNTLACKLGTLVGSLRTRESKLVVNKIFNIVVDLLFPEKHPNWNTDLGRLGMKVSPSPNNEHSHSIPKKNVDLSPKSVFLLNTVSEKLIQILLEEHRAHNNALASDQLSNEISAECQLFNMLQNVCSPSEGYDMADLLENLEEIDEEYILSIVSHSLVKSLMEELSQNVPQPPRSPLLANKQLTYSTREKFSGFPKAKRPELKKLRQGKGSVNFTSYEGKPLTGALNDPKSICSETHTLFDKHFPRKLSHLPPLQRPGNKRMNTAAIFHSMQNAGGMSTIVYSATFLEEIIVGIFLNLYTSLWAKTVNITEAELSEMNILGVNSVVNEFNNAKVSVLENIEESIYFPPFSKESVNKTVDSVYNDVLWGYELQVNCRNYLAHTITSISEQIANSILMEILDYQLPLYLVGRLMPNSYSPLRAENILQKLQNNLKERHYHAQHSYTTMLSHSFLEDVIRKLLPRLMPISGKTSCLGNNYLTVSDFNELSTCIVNKVMLAISKHKIWLTNYDNQHLCTEKNLHNLAESVYDNILQMSDSVVSMQKSMVSQSPIMIDRIASLIIQEVIDNHLQPFLCGTNLPCSRTPLDEVSNMAKEILSEVTESYKPQKTPASSLGMGFYPNTFVEEIVARILSKVFNPNYNTEHEFDKTVSKIVNSINDHFNKAKICILCDDEEHSFLTVDTDIVDELVNSVYESILEQHDLAPEAFNKELKGSDISVENITNLIVTAISDYLFHPLFSGDLSASYYATLTTENITQNIFSGISKFTKPSQHLSLYNTLLPYTFLEDIIKIILSRIFPPAVSMLPCGETPDGRSGINVNTISSKLISDIRMKISQHEIRFSKDKDETKSLYSEDDAQHLVDSVFQSILQNSESPEVVEHNITSSNDVLIDRIAGCIIKNICQQHLHPFEYRNLLLPSNTHLDDRRRQPFFAGVYSPAFLEDVISGVVSKIFHKTFSSVKTKTIRDLEKEQLSRAKELIYLIIEELSKAKVSILENTKEQLCLPTVDRDITRKIIDVVYNKISQEYNLELLPNKDFLSDTRTLAERVTKIILAEVFDFQILPDIIAKLPVTSYSKLNAHALIKRVQCEISKSQLQNQNCTTYTTILSHTHLEKIVTQVLSQISPLNFSEESLVCSQPDVSNTVVRLVDEIMSIISKHAICIIKHGSEKQNTLSEEDTQAMVDTIYKDISQSLTKDKKGISAIPVTKLASYIIKEIFNHHLQSFLPGDKTLYSGSVDHTYKQRTKDPQQRELSFIVNSAVFLEEVISELLCKLLYMFSCNVLASEDRQEAKVDITNIVTILVKSIVLELTTSQILVTDNLDENLHVSEGYKELIQKMISLIYEKLLDEYKSLIHIHMAIQNDTVNFGRKIYYLLLEEIYDHQIESLVSGELAMTSYSSLQEDNIIRNVLEAIEDNRVSPSCITVLPRSLLEDMISKLLAYVVSSSETETEIKEEEVIPDCEFVDAASKLTDEIIAEISAHEIRLASTEEHAGSMQLEATENFIDSICNNIMQNLKFQLEPQRGTCKKGSSFIKRIAAFIIKEIVDRHLQPFLCDEDLPPSELPENDSATELSNPANEETSSCPQASVYSASFLEEVIIDLVCKFCTLLSSNRNPNDKEMPEQELVGMAINFANDLIGEFRKSEMKAVTNAEEIFSFPPVDKKTINKISDSVYDQVTEIYGSSDIQKDDRSHIVTELIASLARKAITAFEIEPLFSGNWYSTFFSFLDVDNIIQKVQHLPYKTFTKATRSLKGNLISSPEQSSASGLKNKMHTWETDTGTFNEKEDFKKEETSMKRCSVQDPICTGVTSIIKSKVTTLVSELAGGVANRKNRDKNKKESSIREENGKTAEVSSPTTRMKSEDTQRPYSSTPLPENNMKNDSSARKDEKRRGDKLCQQFSPATADTWNMNSVLGSGVKLDDAKKSDAKRKLEEDVPFELTSLKSIVKDIRSQVKRSCSPPYRVRDDTQILHPQHVHNITEIIYSNVLEISSFQGPIDDSKSQYPLNDKATYGIKQDDKDFAQPTSVNSASQYVLAIKKEKEKSNDEEILTQPSKPDSAQYPPENNPGIFPENFLEEVISEIVNKCIFCFSPNTDDACQNVASDVNSDELYDAAVKLIDSLLKEFLEAQMKASNQDQRNQSFSSTDTFSSAHKVSLRQEEPPVNKVSPEIKMIIRDKIPSMNKMSSETKMSPSDEVLLIPKTPSVDKAFISKVVNSSLSSILQQYESQYSICKDINSNGENLAKRLANAVLEEIFQHQLNLLLHDEGLPSICLPLESKEFMKKVQKVPQTSCKECQTSRPYTVLLPHEFLENIMSSLLSKIFFTVANTSMLQDNLYTELDFLQMKLVGTVMTEISKDECMIIEYVQSLHPNDDEIIQLVVQTIYNNLLPQFGSLANIQNCITSDCRMLSESIVNLVVREVTGNQLQTYFSGELTPHQCTEIDNVVENVLKDIVQTTEVPQCEPPQAHKLPFHIIEEIAVQFLSKLLSVFPTVGKESNKTLHAEMQKIISKILDSFQEYMSKSQIKVVPQTKESSTISLAESETIEKVVTSVYNSVLKHSGSHISVYKDLLGKSNFLSDIIGFLMVKEISNSEFHPQVEGEASGSELVLEAVKIMEKVVKIIDDLRSKEKASSRKSVVLDALFLEEILALFLARLAMLPSASSKNTKNLSKFELNKMSSQLTKSVTAEISRNNISVVAAYPEEYFLNPENRETVLQIVDSVYNQALQQCGTQEELYYDVKGTNHFFPNKVASLVFSKVLNCPLETVSSKDSCTDFFKDLDVHQIAEKAYEYAVKGKPIPEGKKSDHNLTKEKLPIRIIPHHGKKPINIDPNIVAEHLGVISIKTQPLEKLQMECLAKTGHSIEALRSAMISGRSYSIGLAAAEPKKKERRISLDMAGRLNVKPLEIASRNSFQNLTKPDITKVELLKDVLNKKDLIIRLVAHDISHEGSECNTEENLTSDEDEVVVQEILSDSLFEDQVKEDRKPPASSKSSPKPSQNKSTLKKFLSLGKCCRYITTLSTKSTEASPIPCTDPKETEIKNISVANKATLKSSTIADSSFQEQKPQLNKEVVSSKEPAHFFIHRIMSSSSYNDDDVTSYSSDYDDHSPDPSTKITKEDLENLDADKSSSIKFVTLFQRDSALTNGHSSNDDTSDSMPSTSRQGSEVRKNISTALSKMFSRPDVNAKPWFRSPPPPPPPPSPDQY